MATILEAAFAYTSRGWKLCAVYPVGADGTCACERGKACKTPGKHPRGAGWQRSPRHPLYWQRSRDNIGILTGRASGHNVFDYDPASADDDGRALLARLLAAGVVAHQATGGGGLHFRMALTTFDVHNSQGAGRTHQLPPGWDVRGEGGQYVAAPSASAKGTYRELDPGVAPALDWLYALTLPSGNVVERQAPVGAPPLDSQGTPAPDDPNRANAWDYFNAAIGYEVDDYSGLTDGRRGGDMAAFARSLIEIVNGANAYGVGWTYDQVWPHFEAAVARATANRPDGGYAPHELPSQWHRAIAHVNGRGQWRRMKDAPAVEPPFRQTPAEPGMPPGPPGALEFPVRFLDPGEVPAPALGTAIGSAPPPAPPAIEWAQKVAAKADQLQLVEEARALLAARKLGVRAPLASRALDGNTLDLVPDPDPLIPGWLFRNTLARINGKPGQGKSFVAVDIACSVAAGVAWRGRTAVQGTVIALVAEGLSGFKLRVRAWESDRGAKVGAALKLFPGAVQVLGPEWPEFIAWAVEQQPVLITLDTQARITEGAKENDPTDMGMVVGALERLREATGACVLLVHHASKAGDSDAGRGSNAVEGAMVSEFFVAKSGGLITLKTTKQKDIDQPGPVKLTLKKVDESAVIARADMFMDPNGGAVEADWKLHARTLYAIIQTGKAQGSTWAEIQRTARKNPVFAEPVDSTAIVHAWNNLVLRGLILQSAESKAQFGVRAPVPNAPDGVLTPVLGEVEDPPGWHGFAPHLVVETANFGVNLGKTGRIT